MAPRWVPVAARRPNRCAFIPFLGSHHPGGYFDFGTEIMVFDGHVYCSVIAAEQMATLMGWVPSGDVALSNTKVVEQHERIAELEAERDDLRTQLEAVHTLRAAGYTPSKKPGRPPKEKVTA